LIIKYTITIAGVALCLFAPAVIACNENLPTSRVTIKGNTLIVELAMTPSERACGLSHRASLQEHHGMLFVYSSPKPLSYWMKDTKIPLSIAFIEDTGRILSIQKMTPMQSTERYRSPKPVRYALEVNQGWFAKHNIGIGDIVDLNISANLYPLR
jgi:uncharacterized membrane protein (UPF0127 family)